MKTYKEKLTEVELSIKNAKESLRLLEIEYDNILQAIELDKNATQLRESADNVDTQIKSFNIDLTE